MKRRAAARKTTTKAKPPTKRAKTAKDVRLFQVSPANNSRTLLTNPLNKSRFQVESYRWTVTSQQDLKTGWMTTKVHTTQRLLNSTVVLDTDGLSFSHNGYSYGTTRGSVAVCKGIRQVFSTNFRFVVLRGYSLKQHLGQSWLGLWRLQTREVSSLVSSVWYLRSDGVGCDQESWAINGSQQKKYFNDNAKSKGSDYGWGYSTREVGEAYGTRYWNSGTVVGCLLDLDTNEMSFTYNGGTWLKSPTTDLSRANGCCIHQRSHSSRRSPTSLYQPLQRNKG